MEDREIKIVGNLHEVLQDIKKMKEESDTNARYWAIAHTKLEDALAWIKVYCVEEDEDAN